MSELHEEIRNLGFEVPDSIEPIIAYRSWIITPLDGVNNVRFSGWTPGLFSHNMTPWKPGVPHRATCTRVRGKFIQHELHHSPVDGCSCGVYAAKKEMASHLVPMALVYGEVYLWGKILEGPRGYRAEFCYPKKFYVRSNLVKKHLEGLGYGVPIEVVKGGSPLGFPFPAFPPTPPRYRTVLPRRYPSPYSRKRGRTDPEYVKALQRYSRRYPVYSWSGGNGVTTSSSTSITTTNTVRWFNQ